MARAAPGEGEGRPRAREKNSSGPGTAPRAAICFSDAPRRPGLSRKPSNRDPFPQDLVVEVPTPVVEVSLPISVRGLGAGLRIAGNRRDVINTLEAMLTAAKEARA